MMSSSMNPLHSDELHLPPISVLDSYLPSHRSWPADQTIKHTRQDDTASAFTKRHALPPLLLPSSPDLSTDSALVEQSVHKEMNEIVRCCHHISESMAQHKSHLAHDLSSMRPLLDDMVTTANEILNALLRLRKHHMEASVTSTTPTAATYPIPLSTSSAKINGSHDTHIHSGSRIDHYDNHNIRVNSLTPPTATEFHHQPVNRSNPARIPRRNATQWLSDDEKAWRTSVHNKLGSRKRDKRSRFQGRCHSCNISETPEWRRGPDGARTLCNACGLHYAKLTRKRAATAAATTAATSAATSSSLITSIHRIDQP